MSSAVFSSFVSARGALDEVNGADSVRSLLGRASIESIRQGSSTLNERLSAAFGDEVSPVRTIVIPLALRVHTEHLEGNCLTLSFRSELGRGAVVGEKGVSLPSVSVGIHDVVESIDVTVRKNNDWESICHWSAGFADSSRHADGRKSSPEPETGIAFTRPLGDSCSEPLDVKVSIRLRSARALYKTPAFLKARYSDLPAFANVAQLFASLVRYVGDMNLGSRNDPSYFTPDSHIIDSLFSHSGAKYSRSSSDVHPVAFSSLLDAIRNSLSCSPTHDVSFKLESRSSSSAEEILEVCTEVDRVFHLPAFHEVVPNYEVDKGLSQLVSACNSHSDEFNLVRWLDQESIDGLRRLVQHPVSYIYESPACVGSNWIDESALRKSSTFYLQPWASAAASKCIKLMSQGK